MEPASKGRPVGAHRPRPREALAEGRAPEVRASCAAHPPTQGAVRGAALAKGGRGREGREGGREAGRHFCVCACMWLQICKRSSGAGTSPRTLPGPTASARLGLTLPHHRGRKRREDSVPAALASALGANTLCGHMPRWQPATPDWLPAHTVCDRFRPQCSLPCALGWVGSCSAVSTESKPPGAENTGRASAPRRHHGAASEAPAPHPAAGTSGSQPSSQPAELWGTESPREVCPRLLRPGGPLRGTSQASGSGEVPD